jgi:hypothetical protein
MFRALTILAVVALALTVAAAGAQEAHVGLAPDSSLNHFLEAQFHNLHVVGKISAPGAFLAASLGLYLLFRKPPEVTRHKIRWVHVVLGGVSGLVAMTHGTAYDTLHLLADPRSQMLRSGTWLCTSVFFLVVTGALRFWSWHHHALWRWSHRTFQVLFLAAACVHVIPKVLHHMH